MHHSKNGQSVDRAKKKPVVRRRIEPDEVTQEELRRYQDLGRVARERAQLSENIRLRLAQGAKVEPGEFTARLRSSTQTVLNRGSLIRVLGDSYMSRLIRLLPKRIAVQLVVEEAAE